MEKTIKEDEESRKHSCKGENQQKYYGDCPNYGILELERYLEMT